MSNNNVVIVAIVILLLFVILGAISKPLGVTCESSRYFFGLGGIILGYFLGKSRVEEGKK